MTREELEYVAEDRFEEKPLGYEKKTELMIYRDGFVEGYEYCQASTVRTDNTETLENVLKRIAELEQENRQLKKENVELEKSIKYVNTICERKSVTNSQLTELAAASSSKLCEAKKIIKDLLPYIAGSEFGYKAGLKAKINVTTISDCPIKDEWHYPSKGELPNCTRKVLICYGKEEHIKFVSWRADLGTFGNALPVEITAWRYIEPPKEIAE